MPRGRKARMTPNSRLCYTGDPNVQISTAMDFGYNG